MKKSNVRYQPKGVGNKTTLMDRRVKKKPNKTGKCAMVYSAGKYPS